MVPAAYMALIFVPAEDGGEWGVTFPDLPGCTSSGATFEKAFANAGEALAGHVAMLLDERQDIPPARSWQELMQDTEVRSEVRDEDGTLVPIKVMDVPAPKERINITIDRDVLRRVDEAARALGTSRSAFIEQAAKSQALGTAFGLSSGSAPTGTAETTIREQTGRYTSGGTRSLRLPRKRSA